MAHTQGDIVIADDPFGSNPERPYLLISNKNTPFHGEEYIAAVITSTARDAAVELTENRIKRGRLPQTSYISPWSILTLKQWMITTQPAEATTATVSDVRQELNTYLRS
jgi:mRNA-degrading endonuclease toxin of MazEF toxin-antitoxin module